MAPKSKTKRPPKADTKAGRKTKSKAKRRATTSAKRRATPKRTMKAASRRVAGIDDHERVVKIIDVLTNEYPEAHCMLHHTGAFDLLIATILAAQCTDAMVNRVTPALFAKYPTAQALADAPPEDIEKMIYKTGFFRNKTKSIQKCCRALIDEHGGEVPQSMEELVKLGGVGRKTANCVLGNVFGIPGIVVDTHVKRLANRMGLTAQSDPDKIEADLNSIVPHDEWTHFSHLLADHGRHVCDARKPQCDTCPIEHLCPKIL